MKPKDERYTVAVDFDGVIHSYTTPWVNAEFIPDPPVDGAIEWLSAMEKHFDIVIFTTRAKTPAGRVAVGEWLFRYGFKAYREVTAEKPPALVYIDDRAWRFTGQFPTIVEIHNARPWNKPRKHA